MNYEECEWASQGGLVIMPYYGPWSWMNREARAFIDDLVESVYREFQIPESVPLIATGGSMGGFSFLLYTRYAKRIPIACQALFPACDLLYHFKERPDVARTVYSALRHYPEGIEQSIEEHSPLHQCQHLPNIPYQIIHGDSDTAVDRVHHSDKMVKAMRERSLQVEYLEVAGMGHGPIPRLDVHRKKIEFVSQFLK